MAQPRYHGCDESHITTRWGNRIELNTLGNAYVRVGGKWTVVGEVCTACGTFRGTQRYGPDKDELSAGLQAVWADQQKRSGYLEEAAGVTR